MVDTQSNISKSIEQLSISNSERICKPEENLVVKSSSLSRIPGMVDVTTNNNNTSNNNNNNSSNNSNNKSSKDQTDHYNPSVRILQIPKTSKGSCGFHLTRSKWDPYPWVSAVDDNTPAEVSGLKAGDCVLEVNGEDILGLRISEVAELVKIKPDNVTLLLWSVGSDILCDPESICCGPMPLNLERLSAAMQSVLTALECPVCLDTIPPPVMQCLNGHLFCSKCKSRSEKCPICRERYSLKRSLLAEQIYNSIMEAFNLNDAHFDHKLKEKIFGARIVRRSPWMKLNLQNSSTTGKQQQQQRKGLFIQSPTNKFLAKILGKANSLDNLSTTTLSDNKIDKDNQIISHSNENSIIIQRKLSLSTNDLSIAKTTNGTSLDRNSNNTYNKDDNKNNNNDDDNSNSSLRRASSVMMNKEESNNSSLVSIPRSASGNAVSGNFTQLSGLTYFKRRPSPQSSINTSTECLGGNTDSENTSVSLTVPVPNSRRMTIIEERIFNCPIGCDKKFNGTSLQYHVKVQHNVPIISFGSSNVEISLPPKAPIQDASLILLLNYKQFWLKLSVDDGSIFTSAFIEGFEDESLQYMMEVRLRNQKEDRLLEKELITRSIVHSLTNASWNEVFKKRLGIFYNRDVIRTTFPDESDLLLRIDIKNRDE